MNEDDDDNFAQTFRVNCNELNTISQMNSFFTDSNGHDSLKVFHSNIRSYSKHFDELLVYINNFPQLDILVCSECWLRVGEEGASLEGYDVVTTDRRRNRADGTVVHYSKRLNASTSQISLGDVYGVKLNFNYLNKNFTIVAMYRTFDSDLEQFLDDLETFCSNLSKNEICLFVGDLNICLFSHDPLTDRYLNIMTEAGLVQCIDKPTRVTDETSSCLDHIFLRYNDMSNVQSAVFQTAVTDHYSTALTISTMLPASCLPMNTQNTPEQHYIDHTLLTNKLVHSNWDPILDCQDADLCSVELTNVVKNAINESKKPMQFKNTRFKKLKPWISNDLIHLIRNRDKLSKRLKKRPFDRALRHEYCILRQNASNSLKYAKRQYYREKLNQANNNAKLFWSVINDLAGRSKPRDSFNIGKFLLGSPKITPLLCKEVANDFNSFFASVGSELASVINSSGPQVLNDSDYALHSVFTLRTVTEQDVIRHVMSLRGGSSPGLDGVPASVLKNNLHILSKPLLHLVNLSLSKGIFPSNLKTARVCPLYKASDYTDKNNFRPISLLSVFSKIIEKIVKEQLVLYLKQYDILVNCQYGFREGKNISDALFDVNKEINEALSLNLRIMLILLDLKKAFDSVCRKRLLSKLEAIGVRGNALSFFKSYLSDRFQCVSLCGVNSDTLPVEYGVVQGSTLGPILFLIYINNISKLTLNCKLFLFADDTLLLLTGKNWQEVRLKALSDLFVLKRWFDNNLLSLNISKTKFLPISLSSATDYQIQDLVIHNCSDVLSTTCSCEAIDKVYFYKYLGVIFDCRMKWSEHIIYLKKKIRKYIYAFRQLSYILNQKEIKLAYYAYVQSLLSYGIIAWGGSFKTIIKPVVVVQKAILKTGFKKNKRYPTNLLFQETETLSVRHLFIKQLLDHMYKNFDAIFTPIQHSYNTRYARNVGVSHIQLVKSYSITNPFYIAQSLYRNICTLFPHSSFFYAISFPTFQKLVKQWLKTLSVEEADAIILTDYRQRT